LIGVKKKNSFNKHKKAGKEILSGFFIWFFRVNIKVYDEFSPYF